VESAPRATAGELGFKPIKWFVLVRPHRAKTNVGMIALTGSDQKAQEVFNQVGQIMAMGKLCNKALTTSKLWFQDDPDQPKVGDWVMYPAHTGTEVPTNSLYTDDNGDTKNDILKVIKETDILMVVDDPAKIWSWIAG